MNYRTAYSDVGCELYPGPFIAHAIDFIGDDSPRMRERDADRSPRIKAGARRAYFGPAHADCSRAARPSGALGFHGFDQRGCVASFFLERGVAIERCVACRTGFKLKLAFLTHRDETGHVSRPEQVIEMMQARRGDCDAINGIFDSSAFASAAVKSARDQMNGLPPVTATVVPDV